jgi:hypothetical protein
VQRRLLSFDLYFVGSHPICAIRHLQSPYCYNSDFRNHRDGPLPHGPCSYARHVQNERKIVFEISSLSRCPILPLTVSQMLFNLNTEDLCIIFSWWHIRDFATLLFSLFAIVLLTAGYEALREASRRYEKWVEKKTEETPSKLALVLFSTNLAVICDSFVCSDIARL